MDLNIYTIALLALNLVSSLAGHAYYFLRKKLKIPTPPVPLVESPQSPAPFASPEFVTEVLERV